MQYNPKIIMVGPDTEGLGGISRVCKTWKQAGFFDSIELYYITSVSDIRENQLIKLIKNYFRFIYLLIVLKPIVYIHTSSRRSFYRKCLFLLTSLLLRKKYVIHIHPSHFHDFLKSLRVPAKWLLFALIRRCSALIVLSEEMVLKIKHLFPKKPVYLLRNPVFTELFRFQSSISRKSNRLLFLGWYMREKGVYDLVDAVSALCDQGVMLNLDFHGTKDADALRRYVTKKGLNGPVYVGGWLDDQQKVLALGRCTALVLPSYSEGMPNVVLEAMASRTPVIATHVGALKEILRDNENALIVNVGDPKDLAAKIRYVIENPQTAAKIADNAYRDVCARFDVDVIKTEFQKIIYEIEPK